MPVTANGLLRLTVVPELEVGADRRLPSVDTMCQKDGKIIKKPTYVCDMQ